MATLTIRNLSDEVHRSLRVRAALHGRSTEAEVRAAANHMSVATRDNSPFVAMGLTVINPWHAMSLPN